LAILIGAGIFFVSNASQAFMSHGSLEVGNASERNAGFIMANSPGTGLVKDEAVLVTEAKAGSYEAFEDLVNRYEKKIYRLGLNLTGNPEDAEDMLQETFLKAFEHLSNFREDSRFYTWIVRIAINQGLMKLRKRRSSKEVQMEDAENEDGEVIPRDFADWRPNPEQELERTELETILQNAARSLPMTFRTVFFLRDVEGLSTEETAELLNLSEGAVKARLFRARLRLREELSKILKRG
jgi:RNA polymerase sigma-70 factor, ECF subfamily